ncbi:MAG: hypothetical protein E6R04_08765 [Spirochaetes bacterium]|nr:MAG: hypothetical protein E6R04_08765 [Spirochaetota bacterium]
MSMIKESLYEYELALSHINDTAFDLTMKILEQGKKDVSVQLDLLRSQAGIYAEATVGALNWKSEIEREIAKDCATAGFLMAINTFKTVCEEVLRADYTG